MPPLRGQVAGTPIATDSTRVRWPRAMDMNDRFLRKVITPAARKDLENAATLGAPPCLQGFVLLVRSRKYTARRLAVLWSGDLMSQGPIADVSTATRLRSPHGNPEPRLVPALTIVSHSMAHRAGERLLLEGLLAGREVSLSRIAPDFLRPGSALGTPLADPFLSRKPLVFAPGSGGGIQLRLGDTGMKLVAGEPVHERREFSPEELVSGVPIELAERVVLLLHLTPADEGSPGDTLGMAGQSAAIQLVREQIERVSDLNVPVLIRGETGSGKELIAQAIHQRSPRRSGRFVSVNMGALPKELAAAELFGAHKGAYTGASRDREGFFRAAQGSSLFLDEVGESPPEVQVLLLRALETGEIYPVGGHSPVTVDVRLIAATDANLEEQIREGRFKAPLLHRLAGYELRVPPLRQRREDIGLLIYHFARQELEAVGEAWRLEPKDPYTEPWLPAPLAARLVRYSWPGNIRQLRNLVRQLVISNRGRPMVRLDPQLAQELDSAASPPPDRAAPASRVHEPKRRKPSEVTQNELLAALREEAWDLKAAADRLGIPRSSIYDMIERNPNIRTAGDLSKEEIVQCFRECQGDLDAMVQRLEVSKRALSRRLTELGLSLKAL